MDDIHIGLLFVALALLIGCSAFFSGSETGLMTLNRYRLRHRAKAGDKEAHPLEAAPPLRSDGRRRN